MSRAEYTKEQAQVMADSLTATVYFRKGEIRHRPPGPDPGGWEEVKPRKGAMPILGHQNDPVPPGDQVP